MIIFHISHKSLLITQIKQHRTCIFLAKKTERKQALTDRGKGHGMPKQDAELAHEGSGNKKSHLQGPASSTSGRGTGEKEKNMEGWNNRNI